jgi:hypothetical protein
MTRPTVLALLAWRKLAVPMIALCIVSGVAPAAEIWFAGTDPVLRKGAYKDTQPTDFMQLFDDNAPWGYAAKNVKVFKTYTQFVREGTDDQLRKMFAGLKKRNISLALEAPVLPVGANGCGQGIEGYLDPHGLQQAAERIRRLGGDLRYVTMDEPLWFGHVANQPNTCHSPIDALARDAAATVALVKKVFPEVEFGDVEPVGAHDAPADWLDELTHWVEAYQKASGVPLRFLDTDLTWDSNWQPQLRAISARLHAAGIAFGIVYDGDGTDKTGEAWTLHAEERFTQVELDSSLRPDRAILQSWMAQPIHMLPESAPGSMTYLVDRYLAAQVTMTLERRDDRLLGHLSDSSGKPVGGGHVQLTAVHGGSAGIKTVRTLSGVVPATANRALVALRINAECGCSGPADVSLGSIHYRDAGSDVTVRSPLLINNADSEFTAKAGQPVSRSSDLLAVTAGGPFTLEVPMGATDASANSGYLGLIFLDAAGKETGRQRLPFQPAEVALSTATSDSGGKFSIPLPANVRAANPLYRVVYTGGDRLRRATASVP